MLVNNNFKINLSWTASVEKIYEYVISNCKDYFGLQNSSYLTFHIVDFKHEGKLFVAIYNDYYYNEVHNYFANLDFKNINHTGLNFKTKFINLDNLKAIEQIYYDQQATLKVNEIRYLFLNLEDIKYLLNLILSIITKRVTKIKNIFSKIIYDNCNCDFKFFASTEYDSILNSSADYQSQFVDITNKVVSKFI